MSNVGKFYNYRTERYGPIPADCSDLLPQEIEVQGIYEIFILKGLAPMQAFIKVMEHIDKHHGNKSHD